MNLIDQVIAAAGTTGQRILINAQTREVVSSTTSSAAPPAGNSNPTTKPSLVILQQQNKTATTMASTTTATPAILPARTANGTAATAAVGQTPAASVQVRIVNN